MSLPVTGQTNWGVPLNAYITNTVLAAANQALSSITSHTTATDPHGDRAYANGLVSAITSGVNAANGFAKLNGAGQLPNPILPAGGFKTNLIDIWHDYSVGPNTGADVSTGIQNALNACASAGGGEVWVPDGVYAIGSALVISSNTWLHLSPGAVIRRMTPASGAAPSWMISNANFAATPAAAPSGSNIMISGGTWDATGNGALTSGCRPILLVRSSFCAVVQTTIETPAYNCCVEMNGSTNIVVRDCVFTGASLPGSSGVPAVRVNWTSTSTTPAGLATSAYNNQACRNILVESCSVAVNGTNAPFGTLVSADIYQAGSAHSGITVTQCQVPGYPVVYDPPIWFNPSEISDLQVFGNQFPGGNLDITATGNVFIGPAFGGGSAINTYINGLLQYATGQNGALNVPGWQNCTTQTGQASGTIQVCYLPIGPKGVLAFSGAITIAGSYGTNMTIAALPTAWQSVNGAGRWTVVNYAGSNVGLNFWCYLSGGDIILRGPNGGSVGDVVDVSGIVPLV